MFAQRRRICHSAPHPDTFSATRPTSTDDTLPLPLTTSPIACCLRSRARLRQRRPPLRARTAPAAEAASQLTDRRDRPSHRIRAASVPPVPRLGRSTPHSYPHPHSCTGVLVPCVYLPPHSRSRGARSPAAFPLGRSLSGYTVQGRSHPFLRSF